MIYSSGNTVKNGVMWCDDADQITQSALDIEGYTWDDPWTIQFALEHTGLGNALLALGAPLPRHKDAAKKLELIYLQHLYGHALEIVNRHGFTVVDCRQWLGREDRKVSCMAHARIWMDTKVAATNTGIQQLASGMVAIYGADKNMTLRNVMGTRFIMTGLRLLEGERVSNETLNNLKDFLRNELDHV